MCGIWALLRHIPHPNPYEYVKYLQARGPEDTSIVNLPNIQLGFTRLAINGLNTSGMQPFRNASGSLVWMCNGEIYNWAHLAKKYNIQNNSGSDCEILGELFEKLKSNPSTFFRELDGVFAMVIVDLSTHTAYIGRDPYGVRPLFVGTSDGEIGFASEAKGLTNLSGSIYQFPPGFWWSIDLNTQNFSTIQQWHSTPFIKNPSYTSRDTIGKSNAATALRFSLEEAIEKRLLTERPIAALLSGGIDSSLIAALVQRKLNALGKPALETFSIGFEESPDLFYAKKVAEWIGSKHNEIIVTPDDFIKAIPHVIRATESYDITTIRASVGNWLVGKAIKERSQAKVVFNGDGSDEVFGSYKYFKNAPNDALFEEESKNLLEEIHFFDGLRSDRCISSHGLEPRTPFLDKQFVAVALSIGTEFRRIGPYFTMEKGLLREAFSVDSEGWMDGNEQILPNEVLWRAKEAFSDGVSKAENSWHEIIKNYCCSIVPLDWKDISAKIYGGHLMPETEEAFYYRQLFHSNFGNQAHMIPHYWLPKWCGEIKDPSARVLA